MSFYNNLVLALLMEYMINICLFFFLLQVWFQNRRSKERRMKQLSQMGTRRHFFRSPRRAMRPLRPGMSPDGLDDSPDMVGGHNAAGYAYFSGTTAQCLLFDYSAPYTDDFMQMSPFDSPTHTSRFVYYDEEHY